MYTFDQFTDEPTDIKHKSGRRVLSSISESWKRCRDFGLAKTGKPLDAVVSEQDFRTILERNESVRQFVLPELELLYNQIAGTNFMVAYADNVGVVLDSIQDSDFKAGEGGKAVIPGSVWLEDQRGTNALGMALHTKRPAVVAGPDHFFKKLNDLSCFAVPLFDHEEKIIGVIDATSDARSRNEHTLALVKLAAKNIENRLLVENHSENLILMFHARHEYLPTTSVGLIAVDEFGFIEGVNRNAKSMLTGLNTSRRQHFSEIFDAKFSSFMDELSESDVLQIKDALGSTVFIKAYPPPSKRIIRLSSIGNGEMAKSDNSHPQLQKPFEDEVLKKAVLKAFKTLKSGLPLIIEGEESTGKTTLADHILDSCFLKCHRVTVDCRHLSDENIDKFLFGIGGALSFFEPSSENSSTGKLGIARGGSIVLDNAHMLSKKAQKLIEEVMAFEEERRLKGFKNVIKGWALIGPKEWLHNNNENLLDTFINSVSGYTINVPNLGYRTDFKKIANCMLQEISDDHILSPTAHTYLQKASWQGNLRQLRKVLRQAISNTEASVIRSEIQEVLSLDTTDNITGCPACANSPVRSESCIMIKKTWRETSGNVSLVARRLGISRNTVYKHVMDYPT